MGDAAPSCSLRGKRVWVAGHNGMVGSALMRTLERENCILITAPRQALDLTRQAAVEAWMDESKPQAVFLAAARVGGIVANSTRPADFLEDNLTIATNVIHAVAAAANSVEKLLFLGSSCIYPNLPRGECHSVREFIELAFGASGPCYLVEWKWQG